MVPCCLPATVLVGGEVGGYSKSSQLFTAVAPSSSSVIVICSLWANRSQWKSLGDFSGSRIGPYTPGVKHQALSPEDQLHPLYDASSCSNHMEQESKSCLKV